MNQSNETLQTKSEVRRDYEFSQRLKCAVSGPAAAQFKNTRKIALAAPQTTALPKAQTGQAALRLVVD